MGDVLGEELARRTRRAPPARCHSARSTPSDGGTPWHRSSGSYPISTCLRSASSQPSNQSAASRPCSASPRSSIAHARLGDRRQYLERGSLVDAAWPSSRRTAAPIRLRASASTSGLDARGRPPPPVRARRAPRGRPARARCTRSPPAAAMARNARRYTSSANSDSTSHGAIESQSCTSSAIATNSAFSRRSAAALRLPSPAPAGGACRARRRRRDRRPAARPGPPPGRRTACGRSTFGMLVDDRHRRLAEPSRCSGDCGACPSSTRSQPEPEERHAPRPTAARERVRIGLRQLPRVLALRERAPR